MFVMPLLVNVEEAGMPDYLPTVLRVVYSGRHLYWMSVQERRYSPRLTAAVFDTYLNCQSPEL